MAPVAFVNSFSEDENYIFIAKFAKIVFFIPVTNARPEWRATAVNS